MGQTLAVNLERDRSIFGTLGWALANVEHLCYIARNKVGCTLNFWGEIIWQLRATTLNGM